MIRFLKKTDGNGFDREIERIAGRGERELVHKENIVRKILKDVKGRGDKALVEYTGKFDGIDLDPSDLLLPAHVLDKPVGEINPAALEAIEFAAARIETFHKRQLTESWTSSNDGIVLGQRVTPLEKVGIYVPGGKAVYPSTVLMNTIPAKVAGVKEIIMVTPPSSGGINPYVLTAAGIAGVNRIYQVGGAQAIGALAYGTETVPRVDKIVGPGNIYVATAKRLVYGIVDIDIVAGPSEILIINDGTGDPACIAADILSQAEHDEMASSILITTSLKMAEMVEKELASQLGRLKRTAIAEVSLKNYGAIILVDRLDEAFDISNRIAPEHLEIIVKDPLSYLDRVKNAGAIFLGENTPEPIGDYIAGPNHVLPTGGSARFFSVLGVEDFIKRSSVISFDSKALERLGGKAVTLAGLEGLEAHARAIEIRLKKIGGGVDG